MENLIILIPVYNDCDCLKILCSSTIFQQLDQPGFEMVIVNDGSASFPFDKNAYGFPIDIINLHSNLGHQKALAIGLSYIFHNKKALNVIVMDADGEDDPADIAVLIKTASHKSEKIVFATRIKRKESFQFRAGYQMYKLLFRLLTGRHISFGNFVLIPFQHLGKLVYRNDIWNHLAAGIVKSSLPLVAVPLERKARFTGTSTMNFSRLVLHGLGAISVFIEFVSTRLLVVSLLLLVCTTLAIIGIITIKSFTNLAIPGWASTLTAVMMIIFLQSFLLTLFTLVLYLSSQSQKQFIPAVHFNEFIAHSQS